VNESSNYDEGEGEDGGGDDDERNLNLPKRSDDDWSDVTVS
jgi:hypothetical protein